MQWLVYVHNHPGAEPSREAGALLDEEAAPPAGEPGSYARVWIDNLASDPASEVRKIVSQLFADYPPIEGLSSTHMTEMASLELLTGPGFEDASTIAEALVAALATGRAKVA